ncbi:CC0125/CC1285 family lipoprotein, partial [Klebsiella aerogenes]
PKRPRFAALALILAGSISLSACMTATPYQPATGNGTATRNGYSDTQIESNRFRISFSGNSLTARETVERYLLYRAAELTLQQGFDHFI